MSDLRADIEALIKMAERLGQTYIIDRERQREAIYEKIIAALPSLTDDELDALTDTSAPAGPPIWFVLPNRKQSMPSWFVAAIAQKQAAASKANND